METMLGKRIYRLATAQEKANHKRIRQQIQEELPELRQRAQQVLIDVIQQGAEIRHTVALLGDTQPA